MKAQQLGNMWSMMQPMIQQQLASMPLEQKKALSKIQVRIVKQFPGITVTLVSDNNDAETRKMAQNMFASLGETLPNVCGMLGAKVKVYGKAS